MNLRTGTSGYSYPQWRGTFYPADIRDEAMLGYYAGKLRTVEINNTFYRIPKPAVVANWVTLAPSPFEFVIKASQRITHKAKLVGEDARSSFAYLVEVLTTGNMVPQLAAILLQTPHYVRASEAGIAGIEALCSAAPPGVKLAFELQHPSWNNEELHQLLSRYAAGWVIADRDDGSATWPARMPNWAYIRLRKENYAADELARWIAACDERQLSDAWVFFKHEDTARGAEMAVELATLHKAMRNR
jgi:uncharacterized protein YecE (DUF72 family)